MDTSPTDTPGIWGSRPVRADLQHKMVALGLVLGLLDMGDMSKSDSTTVQSKILGLQRRPPGMGGAAQSQG